MVKRRHREQQTWRGRMHPGKVDQCVPFLIVIPDAVCLVVRAVWDLVIVSSDRCDHTKLIFWRPVVDQRAKSSKPVPSIMEDCGSGRLKPVIAAVPVQAHVIRQPRGMASQTELI